jgi:sugar phosphate isomerase/epimerase
LARRQFRRSHEPTKQPTLKLTELPARAREAGIGTLEVCHFHFPSTAPEYLAEFRAALQAANVELFTILIDAGNITNPDPERRDADIAMIKSWMDVAAAVGARGVRIVAGDAAADDREALERSVVALRQLAAYGEEGDLRVRTENFKALTSTAANCIAILDALDDAVGFCADMGNFPSAVRVEEFTKIAPRAEVVHTKASYAEDGTIDPEQLRACLDASVAANFDGPYTLVFDRPGDEWEGIMRLKEHVVAYTS